MEKKKKKKKSLFPSMPVDIDCWANLKLLPLSEAVTVKLEGQSCRKDQHQVCPSADGYSEGRCLLPSELSNKMMV